MCSNCRLGHDDVRQARERDVKISDANTASLGTHTIPEYRPTCLPRFLRWTVHSKEAFRCNAALIGFATFLPHSKPTTTNLRLSTSRLDALGKVQYHPFVADHRPHKLPHQTVDPYTCFLKLDKKRSRGRKKGPSCRAHKEL